LRGFGLGEQSGADQPGAHLVEGQLAHRDRHQVAGGLPLPGLR